MPEDTENKDEPKTQAEWQKREFAINGKMREVCRLGIAATQAEIATLKRKLAKIQYGS